MAGVVRLSPSLLANEHRGRVRLRIEVDDENFLPVV